MDFVNHLKKAVSNGELNLGISKVGDWFTLLSIQQMKELSEMLDRVQNNSKYDADYLTMLVVLLCQLEGFNLFEKYKDDVTEPVELFSSMVGLEILKRSGRVSFHGKLSFDEDCQIEMPFPQNVSH